VGDVVLLKLGMFSKMNLKQGLLLPWKQNLEAGLMWKMSWSVHYHVLSLKYLCFLARNKLSLHIDCSARCIIECWFQLFLFMLYGCATFVVLEKLYSWWVMDPTIVY